MILIPEQISYLRKQRETIIKNIAKYQDYLKNKEISSTDRITCAYIGDSLTDEQLSREITELRNITNALKESQYLVERNLDQIEIGTKFVVRFDDYSETETFILTDCIFGLAADNIFVSRTSLFGKNVLGKEVGDVFNYDVLLEANNSPKRTISGQVVAIKRDTSDYLHYIRERSKSARMSKLEKKKIRTLSDEETEDAKKELASYKTITLSQKYLLELEAKRLTNKTDMPSATRLGIVRNLLKRPIAVPQASDKIEIGSKFDILITDRNNSSTLRTCEMINCAVSDELEDAYVERISPLGHSVYGLQQNDTFEFKKDNQTYSGKIINIHKLKEYEEQRGYQYKKDKSKC